MTVLMRIADRLLHLQPNQLREVSNAKLIGSRPRTAAAPPRWLSSRWMLSESSKLGRPLTTLIPRRTTRPVTVVYIHGGAYVNEITAPHWAIIDRLARDTGATVLVPAYGLAPEHTVDEAFELLTAILTDVRTQRPGDRIFLAGDSAGGGLALAFAQEHRDDDLRPDGLFLFSPWLDVTMENPDARRMEKIDAMLGIDGLRYWGEQWAGWRPVRDPRVSPGLGELSDLPSTWVYQGGRDLFLPDVAKFTVAARAAGSPVRSRVFRDGFHVFVGLTMVAESRTVFREIRRTLLQSTSGTTKPTGR